MVDYVKTFNCPNCSVVASGRGHLCHPSKDDLPFTCEYCGKSVDDPRHFCQKMIDKVEYVCKKCGRVAVYSSRVCEPQNLTED